MKPLAEICEQLAQADRAEQASTLGNYPVRSFWISQIGHPCLRKLWYSRTQWEKAAPKDASLADIFWMGKILEPAIFRRVSDAAEKHGLGRLARYKHSLKIAPPEGMDIPRRPEISGRMDQLLIGAGGGEPDPANTAPTETKTLQSHMLQQIHTYQDLLRRPEPWWNCAVYQLWGYGISCHQNGLARQDGILFLCAKNNGQIKMIPCPVDEVLFWTRYEALAHLEELIANPPEGYDGPERIEFTEPCCGRCEYSHLCLPAMTYTGGALAELDEKLVGLVQQRMKLIEQKKEFEALDKAIKAKLPKHDGAPGEREMFLAGSVRIVRSWFQRTVTTVPLEVKDRYSTKQTTSRVTFEED